MQDGVPKHDAFASLGDLTDELVQDVAVGGIKGLVRFGMEATFGHPIRKAISATAKAFSSRLNDADRALHEWIASQDFLAQWDNLHSGRSYNSSEAQVELFIRVTGIQLGLTNTTAIGELLDHFYRQLRREVFLSKDGLAVIGESQAELNQKMDLVLEHIQTQPGMAKSNLPAIPTIPDDTSGSVDEQDRGPNAQIDIARDLLDKRDAVAAKAVLGTLQRKVENGEFSVKVRLRFYNNRAACHLQIGDYANALEDFERALVLDPKSPHALFGRAQVAYLQADEKKALELIARMPPGNALETKVKAFQIVCLHAAGKKNEIEELLDGNPGLRQDPSCIYSLAYVAFNDQNYSLAEELLREHNVQVPDNSSAWELLGRSIGVPIQQRLQKDRPLPGQISLEIKAKLREAEECFSRALHHLEQATNQRELVFVLANRGWARILCVNYSGAKEDLERALQLDSSLEEARRNLGSLHYIQGNTKEAIDCFRQIKASAMVREGLIAMAAACIDAKNPAEARTLLEPLWDEGRLTGRDRITVADLLHAAYHRLGNTTGCEAIISQLAAHSDVDDPEVLRISARHYFRKGELDHAFELMRTFIERTPPQQQQWPRVQFAEMLISVERYAEAAEQYEQVLATLDDSSDSLRYLETLYRAGRLQRALDVARRISAGRDLIPRVAEIEADILERFGDLDAASQLRVRLLNHGQDVSRQQLRLAEILERQGKPEEARARVLGVALSAIKDDPQLLAESARLRTFLGLEDALEFAYQLLQVQFDNPDSHLFYVDCFLRREAADEHILQITTVDTGVTVDLRSKTETKRYTLIDGADDAARRLLSRTHELAKLLVGKRVGERIRLKEGTPGETEYEIISIESKFVTAYKDCLGEFQERFPNHPGHIRVDGLPEENSKLVSILEARRRHVEIVAKVYRAGGLAASSFAKLIGYREPDLFYALITECKLPIWSSAGEQNEEINRLLAKPVVVVDYSALITLSHLDLLDVLKSGFPRLIVAQQTVDSLRDAVTELDSARPRQTLFTDGAGSIDASGYSPVQIERQRQFFDGILNFLLSYATVSAPIDLKVNEQFHFENLLRVLGPAGAASILVAAKYGALLYSDDRPLRASAEGNLGVAGCCTQSVLRAFRKESAISDDQYHRAVAWLLGAGYRLVEIGKDDISWVLRKNDWSPTEEAARALLAISGPMGDESQVVVIAVAILRDLWDAPVLPERKMAFLGLIVQAVRLNRSSSVIERLLKMNANFSLMWTPIVDEIDRGIKAWLVANRKSHP